MISFEEYGNIIYKALRETLASFDEADVKKYWDENQTWVKESYERFLEWDNGSHDPLRSGLVHAMSLDF